MLIDQEYLSEPALRISKGTSEDVATCNVILLEEAMHASFVSKRSGMTPYEPIVQVRKPHAWSVHGPCITPTNAGSWLTGVVDFSASNPEVASTEKIVSESAAWLTTNR